MLATNQLEAVPLIEADRPVRGGPGADQQRSPGRAAESLEQRAPDAAPLVARRDVGVADQVDVVHGLDSHHADQLAVGLVPPELHAGFDLAVELLARHIRLVPAVARDHAAIGLGRGIHDPEDRLTLVLTAETDQISVADYFRPSSSS